MKILVMHPGPHFSVQDVYTGWVEALRAAGQHVVEFNLGDRLNFYGEALRQVSPGVFAKSLTSDQVVELAVNGLYAALYRTQPDVLLVVSGFFVTPEMLQLARARGTAIVLLHTESPYEDERQLKLAPYADLNLLNDPVNIETYRQHAKAVYLPHAYRPHVHCPGPAEPALKCDFAFAGTGYDSRIRFFEAMDFDGVDAVLAGHWGQVADSSPLLPLLAHARSECLDNTDAVQLYRSAQVGMNLYRREAQRPDLVSGWALGPREVEMAATGLFFLRDPRGENDEVLGMLPAFGSPGEASELLRWHLDHDDVRARLAAEARDAVADRTFDHYAAALLRMIIE